ncbi:reverse transcriptase domain-containing protein [Tanacetum coccineum]
MEQYLARVQDDIRPGVVKPKIGNDVDFEINSNFMRELRRKLFKGLVTTWDLLEKAFIRQYCPPLKTAKKLEEIRNFKQEVDEPLYRAWERYSDLLYRCPQHDLNSQQRVHIFYTGLYIPTRIMLDSKGFIPLMTPTQALKLIQVMADHSHNWYDKATCEKVKARMTMGKENVKEPVPRDLPVVQTYVPPTKFLGSPSRTHETVCMMGILEEIHKMNAQEDEGKTDDG